MGDVISLDERRRALAGGISSQRLDGRFARTTFAFDLALPQTYLAAERVDRDFPGVRWQPAYASAVWDVPVPMARLIREAEQRASELGAPLVWLEPMPVEVRPAMRAAALACELGRGAAFVLAASRLAFCGGFDLGDPEVLAEAAAAACIPLDACIDAAGDARRDTAMLDAGHRLADLGARALPALRVGRQLFDGEGRITEAFAAAIATA